MNQSTIAYYTTHAENLAKRYESADLTALHDQLKSSFPPGSRLLELGCGSGRDAAFLLAEGFDVLATDGVQEMIASAARHHPELKGRLQRIRLPEELSPGIGPFDGVYAVATFMHLTRPAIADVFQKIRQILAIRGRLFFSVPMRREDVHSDEFDDNGRRFTAMTASEWADICRNGDFKIISSRISADGLGRKHISWLNCLAARRKENHSDTRS